MPADDAFYNCSTPGCPGDPRYPAPGRGHLSTCHYPSGTNRVVTDPDTSVPEFVRSPEYPREWTPEEKRRAGMIVLICGFTLMLCFCAMVGLVVAALLFWDYHYLIWLMVPSALALVMLIWAHLTEELMKQPGPRVKWPVTRP